MNIRFLPLSAFLFLAAGTAYGQAGSLGKDAATVQANMATIASGSSLRVEGATSLGVVGSPYADSRWLTALLTLNNGMPLAPVPLKYDVLQHRLLMLDAKHPKDSLLLDDHQVVRFVLQEPASARGPARQREFRRFREAPQQHHRPDYVEVLHEGSYTLLKHYVKTVKKADYYGAYSQDRRTDEIEDKSTYYLLSPEARLAPVKLNLKTLQSAAPPLAAALKTTADTQKPKTEAQWVSVLQAADPKPAK
ncbi:hypothetical protein [Hymenobacter arizonensis]|uniref:Outer membrane lipoprotein-sorting protein n=1 Tax=Hymenobacter arizonensis TaxID=1227077 RepID=A0A1I5UTI9_HYMAR|nr:hypothetical protein [Hymenobacter arizonensis]SFP98498.1 hypothetical protein SAMN04515668_1065 [Hymenobacter arizonensis]